MINLLPENEKKDINREYKLRRLALIFVFVFIMEIFVTIFLLPSFVLSWSKVGGASSVYQKTANKSDSKDSALTDQINSAKQLADALKPEMYSLPSSFIDILSKNKTSQNIINSISYSRDATGSIVLNVTGISKSRQSLASFKDSLEKEPGIGAVDIPVSNFTKESDINFSFTINLPVVTKK